MPMHQIDASSRRVVSRSATLLVLFFFAIAACTRAAFAQSTSTLTIHVIDGTNAPVANASIRISGAGTVARTIVTGAAGDAHATVPPGTYQAVATAAAHAGRTATDVTVVPGSDTRVVIILAAAAANVPAEIGRVSATNAGTAVQSIAPISTIPLAAAVGTRANPALENYAVTVPGLTYFHSAKSNLDHFKIRGADNEPRTELDGHLLTNTGAGNFLVGWMNAYAFDRIEVEKGPGIAEGVEGRSVFGTINLISREFSDKTSFDSTLGVDSAYGSTVSLNARGALGSKNRFEYVLGMNNTGAPDVARNQTGLFLGPAKTNTTADGSALAAYSSNLSGALELRNEIVKARYAFSPVTTLDVGYLGFQGIAAPLGGSYVGYEGNYTIAPCLNGSTAPPTAAGCTSTSTYGNPALASSIGSTQPLFSGYTNGSEVVNEPFFDAQLRTQVGNGILTLSPFTGIISDILTYAAPATPIANMPVSKYTSDRLHGFTATYFHTLNDGWWKLNYSYHSDQTLVYTGAPFTFATLTTPPTTLHENDLSLTSSIDVTPRLNLGAGLFFDAYHNDGQIQSAAAIASVTPPAQVPFVRNTVSSTFFGPHLGFAYRLAPDTTARASFGSSVYGPGSTLISGKSAFTPPAASNNNQGLLTLVNPNLKPEVTVAYDVGLDQKLADGGVLTFDAYAYTIFNKFLAYTTTGSPIATAGGATLNPLVNQTINAAQQRDYGIEVGLHRDRPIGYGYDLALSLNRTYYAQLPADYFTSATAPISPFVGYQGTTNPYLTLHTEWRYRFDGGTLLTFGSDTVGADNVQRAPGYTTFYAAVRHPVAHNVALQFSVENLFNYQTAAQYVGTGPTGSGSSTITALPQPSTGGLIYSQQLVGVLGVVPRVFHMNLITHVGRP